MEGNNNTFRFKILGEVKTGMRVSLAKAKSLKQYDEYAGIELRVLGVPFGGPVEGRDADGEAFTSKTDIWLNVGDTVPVTYIHGFGPDEPDGWQETPVAIGKAKYTGQDERGHWFDVRLDENEPLAKRVLDNPDGARASSGAVSHLVRMERGGLIGVWPVGELAVFDTNEWRQPANEYAVVMAKSDGKAEDAAETIEVKTAPVPEEAIAVKSNIMGKQKMEDEIKKEVTPVPEKDEVDIKQIADMVLSAVQPLADELAEIKKAINEPVEAKSLPVFNVKKVTDLGFSGDARKSFVHWIKTGDEGAVKAALQGQTDTEGGYLVPDDFYAEIISKVNEISIPRKAGARIIQTSRDVVKVPVEGTQASFTIAAEEGSYSESEPQFSQVSITIHKATMLIKMSEELAADNATNLDSWLVKMASERLGVHENDMVLSGSGSSEPQGILVGGTAGLTFDDTNTIAAGEIPELFYKLAEQYMPNAVWTLQSATMGYLMGLTGNQFQLFSPPAGPGSPWNLWGRPAYPSAYMEAYSTTAKKSLAVGDWNFYGMAERAGLVVSRNPYLYQANGQIGLFFHKRWGGAVLQAAAFQYGTQA